MVMPGCHGSIPTAFCHPRRGLASWWVRTHRVTQDPKGVQHKVAPYRGIGPSERRQGLVCHNSSRMALAAISQRINGEWMRLVITQEATRSEGVAADGGWSPKVGQVQQLLGIGSTRSCAASCCGPLDAVLSCLVAPVSSNGLLFRAAGHIDMTENSRLHIAGGGGGVGTRPMLQGWGGWPGKLRVSETW